MRRSGCFLEWSMELLAFANRLFARNCLGRLCSVSFSSSRASVAGGTACDANRMWRPSFFLKHGGGTLGIVKSPVCNYNLEKTTFNHGPLSASHNLMYFFSFLSERSGRRRPPAERSALHIQIHSWCCLIAVETRWVHFVGLEKTWNQRFVVSFVLLPGLSTRCSTNWQTLLQLW